MRQPLKEMRAPDEVLAKPGPSLATKVQPLSTREQMAKLAGDRTKFPIISITYQILSDSEAQLTVVYLVDAERSEVPDPGMELKNQLTSTIEANHWVGTVHFVMVPLRSTFVRSTVTIV